MLTNRLFSLEVPSIEMMANMLYTYADLFSCNDLDNIVENMKMFHLIMTRLIDNICLETNFFFFVEFIVD